MASSTGWKLLAAIGALMLVTNACGDDDSGDKGTAGDGDNAGDGDKGGDGDGAMKPAPLLPANTAGIACAADPDCGPTGKCEQKLTGGGLVELAGGAIDGLDLSMATPGGYCSASCKTNGDCGEGGLCFGILPDILSGGGGGGLPISGECRKKCTASTDCREGYECAELNSAALADFDLGPLAGFVSTAVPKSCQPAPAVVKITDEFVGKACSADGECGGGTCLGFAESEDGGAPTQGSCTSVCQVNTDCGATEGVCTGVFYGSGGTCAETCSKDSDCKRAGEGFTCTSALGVKICTPGEPAEEDESDAGTDAGTDAG